ncbi:TLD domain-containing protein [Acrasis kona]|uniref:TLD domain-containing protein n=1 Tax=Acrasis kona TaxID=1008807 RepID=A0AAW2ZF61_9EUKA
MIKQIFSVLLAIGIVFYALQQYKPKSSPIHHSKHSPRHSEPTTKVSDQALKEANIGNVVGKTNLHKQSNTTLSSNAESEPKQKVEESKKNKLETKTEPIELPYVDHVIEYDIPSTILRDQVIPAHWFPKNAVKGYKLCIRASRDGYSAYEFHKRCDNRGPSITIVKSESNHVFGGYTPISWKSPKITKSEYNPETFLFFLSGPVNRPPTKVENNGPHSEHSVRHSAYFGPTFGHDILIADESNAGYHSHSNLGYSFSVPGYEPQTTEIRSFLAGSAGFRVVDYEVYVRDD